MVAWLATIQEAMYSKVDGTSHCSHCVTRPLQPFILLINLHKIFIILASSKNSMNIIVYHSSGTLSCTTVVVHLFIYFIAGTNYKAIAC